MMVYNKADKVKEYFLPKILERSYIDSLVVSALQPQDMRRLRGGDLCLFREGHDGARSGRALSGRLVAVSNLRVFQGLEKRNTSRKVPVFTIRIDLATTANWLKLTEKAATQLAPRGHALKITLQKAPWAEPEAPSPFHRGSRDAGAWPASRSRERGENSRPRFGEPTFLSPRSAIASTKISFRPRTGSSAS